MSRLVRTLSVTCHVLWGLVSDLSGACDESSIADTSISSIIAVCLEDLQICLAPCVTCQSVSFSYIVLNIHVEMLASGRDDFPGAISKPCEPVAVHSDLAWV